MAGTIALLKFFLICAALVEYMLAQPKTRITGSRFLLAQLLLALLTEALCGIMMMRSIPNLVCYDVAIVLEFLLLMAYACAQSSLSRFRSIIAIAAVVVLGAALVECVSAIPQSEFMGTTYMIGSLFTVSAFSFLLLQLAMATEERIVRIPEFWIWLSLVVFFGGSLPITGLLNVLNHGDHSLASALYVINDILFGLRYLMLFYAFRVMAARLSH